MKVVVTGASGFLGGATLRALRRHKLDVTAVSRRPLGEAGAVRVASYARAPQGEALVHLAEARDRHLVQATGAAHEVQTLSQLDALLRNGYRAVVYVSSALVYGEGSPSPHAESDPAQPCDPYTRVKLLCEAKVLEVGGMVLRVANTYGPGMASNNVVSAVLAQVPGDGPLQVIDQTPQRDFVWVDDVAEAIACAVTRGRGPALFNIGTGIATSVGELARLALRLAGQAARPVLSTRDSTRASCLVLNPAAAAASLGWRASTSLEAGLRQLLRHKRVLA